MGYFSKPLAAAADLFLLSSSLLQPLVAVLEVVGASKIGLDVCKRGGIAGAIVVAGPGWYLPICGGGGGGSAERTKFS